MLDKSKNNSFDEGNRSYRVFEDSLSAEHERMLLEESSISHGVVEERGYRTVEKKAELERLGFSSMQRNTPGLLIPIYNPRGEKVLYQFRPDEPRIKDDKPIKYETPAKAAIRLDAPPASREKLTDPSTPLFITEGIKKGDALVSQDLCAVALIGVWNWRGTNEKGGKAALPEWEYIALNDRQIYIVFDSDVMLKASVHKALGRLKTFLESRGAEVAAIYLPGGEGGEKQGVDDFFAAGFDTNDLLSRATAELREASEGENHFEEPDTQASILLQYANGVELFHTSDGEPYITLPVED